ncbi:PREDICTED: ABC transporter G family member 15-like [Nelumbo nucifera]|uniref:ABC transporter G family member 15-like n=2 Tax=Nelumbo nucifera TaxID=4432 RepID=A0A1U7Z336_NELNU|nr:PREDICTED: ABC transporter G family member 15-like [Nelumbo nucifera]
MNLPSSVINGILIEKYRTSEYATSTRRRIRELAFIGKPVIGSIRGSEASLWKQLYTLTRSYTAILARGNSAAFITGFMTFLSVGGFPSFIEEMKVFYRKRHNGHYGNAVFILSISISSFPFLLAVSLATGSITFYMVKLHPGFSHLMFTYTNLLSCIATVEGIMMVVESLVPNYLMGVVVGTRALVRKLLQLFVLHKFHLLFTNCLHRHHHSSTPRGIVRHRKR